MGTTDGSAYRTGVARCPACAEVMREEPIEVDGTNPHIDVCDACGGLWLDWFDGEVQALAASAEAVRLERGSMPPRSRPPAQAACPRCQRALEADTYRFPDASEGELLPDVELLRCPECIGCFVPRASAYLLLDRTRSPRAPTAWEALVRWLTQILKAPAPR